MTPAASFPSSVCWHCLPNSMGVHRTRRYWLNGCSNSTTGYPNTSKMKNAGAFTPWWELGFQLYRMRAKALIHRPTSTDLLPQLTKALNRSTEERWRYGRDFDFYLRDALLPLAEAALACTGDISMFLNALVEAVYTKFGDGAPPHWISLAARLLTSNDQIRRSLALLDRAAEYLAEHPTNGQEHCEALLRAAALAQPHDPAMGGPTSFIRRLM
jgi:hypothetical protein